MAGASMASSTRRLRSRIESRVADTQRVPAPSTAARMPTDVMTSVFPTWEAIRAATCVFPSRSIATANPLCHGSSTTGRPACGPSVTTMFSRIQATSGCRQTKDGRAIVFEPGSLSWSDTGVVLNRQHQRGNPIMRFMPVVDGDQVRLDAELPDTAAGRDALAEVRSGLMTGLSVEIANNRQTYRGGVAHVTAARLTGAGLVDDPALPSSTVQVHQAQPRRRRRWL